MSHSSYGGSGKKPDGRRNNRTPEHSRVQPGQVLNPYGRKGKPKPPPPLTRIEDLYLKEAGRIVSHDGNEPVDARQRLVREEYFSALVNKDHVVRARLLARLQEIEERRSCADREFLEHVRTRKSELTEQFYLARIAKRRPPDIIPHPDHVIFIDGWPAIRGPISHEDRANWEHRKACIRIAAYCHDAARRKFRENPTPEAKLELDEHARHRRWLMRGVPKGWNWREELYCRDSMLEFVNDTIRKLREVDDAAPADCD